MSPISLQSLFKHPETNSFPSFASCFMLYPHFCLETNDCAHLTGENAVETQRCGEVPEFQDGLQKGSLCIPHIL